MSILSIDKKINECPHKEQKNMMNFIAIDIENFKVDLYDEEEFIAAYEAEALDPEDYKSEEDRITELVEDNYCDIAWSRQDAVDKIIEEIELLSIEEGGDDETLVGLAKMLITIAQASWWDEFIERNNPFGLPSRSCLEL